MDVFNSSSPRPPAQHDPDPPNPFNSSNLSTAAIFFSVTFSVSLLLAAGLALLYRHCYLSRRALALAAATADAESRGVRPPVRLPWWQWQGSLQRQGSLRRVGGQLVWQGRAPIETRAGEDTYGGTASQQRAGGPPMSKLPVIIVEPDQRMHVAFELEKAAIPAEPETQRATKAVLGSSVTAEDHHHQQQQQPRQLDRRQRRLSAVAWMRTVGAVGPAAGQSVCPLYVADPAAPTTEEPPQGPVELPSRQPSTSAPT
ncbi:hypothetical protein N2152v2_003502 [Parachlorella kessleri]